MKSFVLSALLLLAINMSLMPNPAEAGQTWLNWNTRSGLPSNNLTCMAVDKGIMAVGSDKGIGIFCENHTSWFNLADFLEILKDLHIRSIDFDSHGTLWAATPRGVIAIDLNDFPEKAPGASIYDGQHGLATIDVEAIQVFDNRLYVGGFGGWLFTAEIQPGGYISSFRAHNDGRMGMNDSHKIVSVGITALAMDYPDGGIYSTRGAGLIRADSGDSLSIDQLSSDWVNDFQAFSDGRHKKIIAAAQNRFNLLTDNRLKGELGLPGDEIWISCVAIAPAPEEETYKKPKPPGYLALEAFMQKRYLYAGTRGHGLWRFADGRWNNFTTADSPLPSDNINRIYYLAGPKKLAILSEGGLTILGISEETQFDIFENSGSAPYWAKTMWPFMQNWGPYVLGYPSPMYYPISEPVSYGPMRRGKDLWLLHAKGISRFVFPAAQFTGTMQYRYNLSSRYTSEKDNPETNLQIEDSSTSADAPLYLQGENIWHHYAVEQPADISTVPLGSIMVSLDLKTMFGPGDTVATITIEPGQQPSEADIARASGTIILSDGENILDSRGEALYSVASLLQECPRHHIPRGKPDQFTLDLAERPWVVFDHNRLLCLDAPVGETVPDTENSHWHEFAQHQLPWTAFDQILNISLIGSAIYVSAAESGVYFLPAAHIHTANEITPANWHRIELPADSEDPDQFAHITALSRWKNSSGEYVAMMHKTGLFLFDGTTLHPFSVPKRNYTAMITDREQNLWLGAQEGLFYINPDLQIYEILDNTFNSKNVVTMAAAPDNAKYPYTMAVTVSDRATLLTATDPVPHLTSGRDSMYRLRVVNTTVIGGGQLLLYDGQKWEAIPRPGVNNIMFDQSFLWISTTCRIIRLYMPTVVQSY